MTNVLERATLFALYQASIALGILLMPIAMLAKRGGVTIPIHRLVDRLDRAYENAQ